MPAFAALLFTDSNTRVFSGCAANGRLAKWIYRTLQNRMGRSMRWWVLAFLAAVVLLGSALGFLWTQRVRPSPTWTAPVARARCPDVDAPLPALLADAEATAVLLWGTGKVRLFVDGKPAFSPPEDPRRFEPGEHLIRAEAEGAEPLALTFRLDAFRPALFHVEATAGRGLTLAWLGAVCLSCPPALDRISIGVTRAQMPEDELLDGAAKALRSSDWRAAASLLGAVPLKSRQRPDFRRLAAHVYQSTGQPALARGELEQLADPDLRSLLAAYSALEEAEAGRERSLGMQRWNVVTDKFAHLLEKFALEAPGPVQLATSRLADLSEGFASATQKKDPLAQDETVSAAKEALAQFIRALRRTRPEDCEFQARISAACL